MKLNKEELKQKAVETGKKYWYILVIIVVLGFNIFQWQSKQSIQNDFNEYKAKVEISEDIKTLESKLDAMKARELEYLKIYETQGKLVGVLAELDKRRKELDQIKKERILVDVQNLSTKDLSRAYTDLNFPNSVISPSK